MRSIFCIECSHKSNQMATRQHCVQKSKLWETSIVNGAVGKERGATGSPRCANGPPRSHAEDVQFKLSDCFCFWPMEIYSQMRRQGAKGRQQHPLIPLHPGRARPKYLRGALSDLILINFSIYLEMTSVQLLAKLLHR